MQGSRCQSRYYVPIEEHVFRHGSESAEEAQGDGERVVTVQEDCGGADASKYGLKGCDRKNAIGPAEKRELVDYSRKEPGISLRQACILFSLHFSVYYGELGMRTFDLSTALENKGYKSTTSRLPVRYSNVTHK